MGGVRGTRAVIQVPADAIAVHIVLGVVRAGIAGVAQAVRISVRLCGICRGRAVVHIATDAIVVHVNDLVDNVTLEGETAGACAAETAIEKAMPAKRKISLKAGENIRYVVPHAICAQKEASLSIRVREPAEKVTIRIGDIFTKSLRVVKPSEMLKINLTLEQLGKIEEKVSEVEVSCRKRG